MKIGCPADGEMVNFVFLYGAIDDGVAITSRASMRTNDAIRLHLTRSLSAS